MTIDNLVEQTFPIECCGLDSKGKKALSKPVKANVRIYKCAGSSMISSEVNCPYHTGAHNRKCIASYPIDKKGISESVKCPYSFDIHYSFQR
ncbi:hypothetical protein FJZ20_02435 [Candidatus Pacearchaeota archaeon]|nr:hypothetical protein [Candidatus Pacearchaeota archaeon]